MFGDLIGVVGLRPLQASGSTITSPSPSQSSGLQLRSRSGIVIAAAPLPFRTSFKVTENESPRPQNRAYVSYNYFDHVTSNISSTIGFPDLHREIIGLEKTFLDGNASVGLRMPFFQLVGSKGVDDSSVGDLSVIFKYALINDRKTGNVLSTGLVVTTPTGPGLQLVGASTINPVTLQPFVGYIYNLDRNLFFQGFTSLAVPTDSRDVTLLFSSLSAGYWLYRDTGADSMVKGIVPVAEFHLSTPFNHRSIHDVPIGFTDQLNFTGGSYVYFRHAVFGMAAGLPLTGPRLYDFEANTTLGFFW